MAKVNSKNRISVDMKEEDRTALNAAAVARGVTVSEFVRSAVNEAVRRVTASEAVQEASKRAQEQAFATLDDEDAKAGFGVPTRPEPKAAFPVAVTRHPCANLSEFIPPNYRSGEIAGTCKVQGMKPCHFHGSSARGCPLYRPYHTPTK